MRLAENPFPKESGVYEMRVVPPKGSAKEAVVLYLGKAGGDDNASSLKQRMGQYMNDGSHKAEMLKALVKAGFTVQTRHVTAGPTTRTTTGSDKCKQVETFYLKKYDYIANKLENGDKRLGSVKVKDKNAI